MRTGLAVNGEQVLSVYLGEPGLTLRITCVTINGAVTSLKWGKSDTKDFLDPSKTDGVLNNEKVQCSSSISQSVPEQIATSSEE